MKGNKWMIQAFIAALAIIVLVTMSLRANRRFANEDRLPMQWTLDGSVNWTAPRWIALSLTPTLAAIILLATVILTTVQRPRPDQEAFVIPTLAFVAAVLIGAHAFHLWLIGKSVRRS
jgi:cytochrome bd-type quinol oxidase subunit 2